MQPPFWILVPGGYKTYFLDGQPAVAEFAFPTEAKIDFKHSEHWYGASNVKGFPAGRSVLFYGQDIGTKLRIVQRIESVREFTAKVLGESKEIEESFLDYERNILITCKKIIGSRLVGYLDASGLGVDVVGEGIRFDNPDYYDIEIVTDKSVDEIRNYILNNLNLKADVVEI